MTQTECSQQNFEFQALGRRNVIANFEGGHLSSDGGGALILREKLADPDQEILQTIRGRGYRLVLSS